MIGASRTSKTACSAYPLLRLVHEVVFEARQQQVLVHPRVEGPHAEAAEVRRGGLHRGDPCVPRSRHEEVLDSPVPRHDPEAS